MSLQQAQELAKKEGQSDIWQSFLLCALLLSCFAS
jgi:hypothetical protein